MADEVAIHEARERVLGEALHVAEELHVQGVSNLRWYLDAYYAQVALEDLQEMDPVDLLGAALAHVRAAALRPPGEAVVKVYTPTLDEHGWSNGHTVVEVVVADMPFLVDSLTSALTAENRGIHLVVHPIFRVSRDEDGELLKVDPQVPEATGEPDTESWIHFDIDRESDPAELEMLREKLLEVLGDVAAAVADWGRMRDTAEEVAAEITRAKVSPTATVAPDEAALFLDWMAERHFTFVGYRRYDLVGDPDRPADLSLEAVVDSGLGILRDAPARVRPLRDMARLVRESALEREPLILTKANSRSTVHRSGYLDYVGVKRFDEQGRVVGEHRFLGLFTAAAYNQSVMDIPVVRAKVAEIVTASGFPPESHSGKDLLQFLETYPRDETIQASPDYLLSVAMSVLRLQERRRTRLFVRRDTYGRFVSCLVYLPRDRYTTAVRLKLQAILAHHFNATSIEFTTMLSESVLARLHFVVRVGGDDDMPSPDAATLERELAAAVRSWDDEFADAAITTLSEENATSLVNKYLPAIGEAYKEAFPARTAVADIAHLDQLADGRTEVTLYYPYGADVQHRRLKIYRSGGGVTLSSLLPILHDLGLQVTDERPFELTHPDGRELHIYDVGVVFPEGELPASDSIRERVESAFLAVWNGWIESDNYHELILPVGLSWQQTAVLRALAKYMRQAGSTFSQVYLVEILREHRDFTELLLEYFDARFGPEHSRERENAVLARIEDALDQVSSLDTDRVFRFFLTLLRGCVRTNFYQERPNEVFSLAFKFLPAQIPQLPQPRPKYEIWVYSPVVAGVHLRFADVARGGLRWSDRPEDFRTEILGLVKAQAVKNAVIVPAGAKGGFYGKQIPPPAADRHAWLAAGKHAYVSFITGLLSLTDNRVGDEVVSPPAVVRHDGDDPYLVVAADKGTASFSDLANETAHRFGFWLGDAFASGGSDGYDHKAMGITARGAWESVKRHFRDLGLDTQTQDFTCVGVGDMSGDVFGNGMLLSQHIRLLAAFDHRHIFLDPDPDPEVSYAERRRLFELSRSSWADYDGSLISQGGGVYSKNAKSIPISEQVRAALGIEQRVTKMTPPDLIRAILKAPADLFWNGGIGTYVKAVTESNVEVGDKANDAVRVNGEDLRCRVVGEGGNLGLTQLGRIEAAISGVQLNTDAIDNSAGVDTSDHEVNIKILLDAIVRAGDLTEKQRNETLESMTDDVAQLVLGHNYAQNVSLGTARTTAAAMAQVHARMIRSLEERGVLDRELERLPSPEELEERARNGRGLTSPELAVLMAYAKNLLKASLEEQSLAEQPYFAGELEGYFPAELVSRFGDHIPAHPLANQIVATTVASRLVNFGGLSYVFRMHDETAANDMQVLRSFTFAMDVFNVKRTLRRIAALDNQVETSVQSEIYHEVRRLLDRAARWLVLSRSAEVDLTVEVPRYAGTVTKLYPRIPEFLRGAESRRHTAIVVSLTDRGVPEEFAADAASLLYGFMLLDIADVAESTQTSPEDVADLYFCISERYDIDTLLTRISSLPRGGRWQALARQALRSDLYQAMAALTEQVVLHDGTQGTAAERLDHWEQDNWAEVERVRHTLTQISELKTHDLSSLSVALRSMRTLIKQAR
ncbi:MAG: NAD-glutamate dehydrogenase [Actinobacteria bacterium]|nr:NAD-glutamate dehydrogenase [Actinomycetota bacterium]